MSEAENALDFIFAGETLRLRAVRRKDELRYIASNQSGSLKALTQFAPPTKRGPKLLLGLLGAFDFRIPKAFGLVDLLAVSKEFLNQVAVLLEIPVERIGIYVGEPDDQRKLVVTDILAESNFVLKIAVGIAANEAIRREAEGIKRALGVGHLAFGIPKIHEVEPIFGKSAILIERIKGRQLTPSAFEQEFMKPSDVPITDGEVLSDWLSEQGFMNHPELTALLNTCEATGALSLRCPLGVVHGDFAPWNVIRRLSSDISPLSSEFCAIDWEFSRTDTPLIFDMAYAARCYSELLGRTINGIEPKRWCQLVALGELWFELRKICQ